jgi:hypothetical protein
VADYFDELATQMDRLADFDVNPKNVNNEELSVL